VIARNDGTKLSSLTNDSPANGGNKRKNEDRAGKGREGERERMAGSIRNLLRPEQ